MILMILSKSRTFIQDLLSKCSLGIYLRHMLGLSRAYLWHILDIPSAYLEQILTYHISITYLGYITGIPWVYIGHNLGWLSRLLSLRQLAHLVCQFLAFFIKAHFEV